MTGSPTGATPHASPNAMPDATPPTWDGATWPADLAAAGRLIDDGRFEASRLRAGALPPDLADAAEALERVATVLERARDDRTVDVDADARDAAERAEPWPPLLRTLARQLGWWGRHAAAVEAYRRLATTWTGAYKECLDERPEAARGLVAPWTLERLLTDPIPDFWAAHAAKRQLLTELGPDAGAELLGRLATHRSPRTAQRLPLVDLDAFAQAHGSPYLHLAGGAPVPRIAPMVWREGRAGTGLPAAPRRFSLAALPDAVVSSKSSVILCAGHALIDIQRGELPPSFQDLTLDPLVLEADDETVRVLVTADEDIALHLPEAFSMVGVHSHAFGHWMFEQLMRLWAFLGLEGSAGIPLLVDARMPPQHRESLAIFAGDRHPVIELAPGDAARVDRLWAGPMPLFIAMAPRPGWHSEADEGFDAPAFATHVRTARASALAAGIEPLPDVERVFLARDDTQHRRIVNRAAVEALLVSRGYRVRYFGELTFREQLGVMLGARSIVVASGSSSTLTLFAPEGAAVGVTIHEAEHAEGWDWHASVGAELGTELLLMRNQVAETDPRYRKHANYRLDLDRLAEFLDDLEALAVGLD